MGRARRLSLAAGRGALRTAGLLDRLALRARSVGRRGGALGRGPAGVLPDLRYPLGCDAAGPRSADNGAASRRSLAVLARPPLLERRAGVDRISGEFPKRLRAGPLALVG